MNGLRWHEKAAVVQGLNAVCKAGNISIDDLWVVWDWSQVEDDEIVGSPVVFAGTLEEAQEAQEDAAYLLSLRTGVRLSHGGYALKQVKDLRMEGRAEVLNWLLDEHEELRLVAQRVQPSV